MSSMMTSIGAERVDKEQLPVMHALFCRRENFRHLLVSGYDSVSTTATFVDEGMATCNDVCRATLRSLIEERDGERCRSRTNIATHLKASRSGSGRSLSP